MSDDREPIFEDEELTLHDEAAVASERARKEEARQAETAKKDNGQAATERFAQPKEMAQPKEKIALKEESTTKNILQSQPPREAPPRPESKQGSTTPPGGKDDRKDETSLFGNVDPMVGKRIADRWEILELLGEGSMSMVYKASEVETGKVVVLKCLHSHLLAKLPNVKRFEQKAKANANLRHPHISNFHDFYLGGDGQVYLICDFINGQSLEDLLSK
ncbi:MAG: hypothetical protein C0507_22100, partial [Cyanobacteria bacterium PR.3.49]|nr:hypothetical protein [Cyanobacteria bacterium PR.3.49]